MYPFPYVTIDDRMFPDTECAGPAVCAGHNGGMYDARREAYWHAATTWPAQLWRQAASMKHLRRSLCYGTGFGSLTTLPDHLWPSKRESR